MKYWDLDYECGVDAFDSLDLIRLVTEGNRAFHGNREGSPGVLRGGSVGALVDGNVYGICHRKAYLRFKGIETDLPTDVRLMTDQGEMNEELWKRDLIAGIKKLMPDRFYVLDQNEFDCTWKIGDTEASGSPDLVIFDKKTDKPFRGIELKNISSVSKAKSSHFERRPASDHLIQAANYSVRMGDMYLDGKPLPYQLVYSSRSMWHFFNMAQKIKDKILKCGWDIQWNFGRPTVITPFHRVFNLNWAESGQLEYFTANNGEWKRTGLTRESIDRYYDVVAHKIDESGNLGPRPTTKHIDGSSAYSPCGYCDFKSVCDMRDDLSPQEFQDHARKLVSKS